MRSVLGRVGYETLSCGHPKHEVIKFMLTAPVVSSLTRTMFDEFLKKKYEESLASPDQSAQS